MSVVDKGAAAKMKLRLTKETLRFFSEDARAVASSSSYTSSECCVTYSGECCGGGGHQGSCSTGTDSTCTC